MLLVLGQVANCSLEDFQAAIQTAYEAQSEFFESTTEASRGALLKKWYNLILAHANDLILNLENGNTHAEAKGEVLYAASFISWLAEEGTRSYGVTITSSSPHISLMTIREPVGIAPALAAGCSGVIKPPNETPYPCLALTKLAIEDGLRPRTIQVCPTKHREAATELGTKPWVAKISFTGSTGVGKLLAELAAGTLKKVSLELGGNAPFIVFDDVDVNHAVEWAMFCKLCCSGLPDLFSANRLNAQKGIAKEFTAELVEKVKALEMGAGLNTSTTQGPWVNKAAVSKVAEHVADATSKGAQVESGGVPPKDLKGSFSQPTFETEEEAVRLANNTEFGMAGYFFSNDVSRVMRVARKLKAGMVGANTGEISAAEASFGGVKESRYGKEGSLYGLAEYQNIKSITIGNLDSCV
ncbi:Succinate-semialdehyde dehydrogenase [Paramyrothecium foliicola]|nr:Succinate-semialdehyde dehydrogenase [Paramyrothecium foliicola]